jgi:hypothetical protein
MVSGRRFEDVHMEGLNGLDTPKQYGYGLISNDLICFLWCNVSFNHSIVDVFRNDLDKSERARQVLLVAVCSAIGGVGLLNQGVAT